MDKQYMRLNGNDYRVEATVRSLQKYCKVKGVSKLGSIENMKEATFEDLEVLVFACLEAGAKMDGQALDITQSDLFDIMRPGDIQVFMEIYKSQSQITSDELAKKRRR